MPLLGGRPYNRCVLKRSHRHRRTALAFVAVGCGLAIAGCGFTGNSSEAASSGGPQSPAVASAFLKFANCMRSHGVPNFPDPGSGRGIDISPGSGIDPASPAYQSAQSGCKKLLPGGGPKGPPPAPSASDVHAALAWARCIRKHGVPNFPDPSTSANRGLFFRGIAFPVGPGFNPESPAFKQAQAACRPLARGG
jgi:hypothetical protein